MAINQVTELDFDQIKANLKEFLSSQDQFNDFDFDGAGISVLLDLLAYNTQYNAVLSHVVMNEAFLDSAEVRSNVVSHSKLVGYVPRSTVSSSMFVDIIVTGDSNSPSQLELQRGTTFTTTISGQSYTFVTLSSRTASKTATNTYSFSAVQLNEGTIRTNRYRVDGTIDFQKFIIQDANVDTDTLIVRVYDNEQTSTYEEYTYYEDITLVQGDSKVYFYQENAQGNYEVFFGDGTLGSALSSNNIVEVQWLSSNGVEGNGAIAFSASDTIGGISNITVSRTTGFTQSFNGANKETVESIRFNAPLYYASQNRAVTSRDYKSIILNEYADIEDVSVWGGESNDPPVYGKVFMSVKAQNQDYISEERKDIIKNFVENKNVGSITTEVLDPDYTKLIITTLFKYDSEITNLSKADLESRVKTVITNYNNNVLNRFDGVFRSSNLVADIDDADNGILNSVIRIQMYKDITPNTLFNTTYDLSFSSPIYITSSTESILTSTEFKIGDNICVFDDEPIAGTTNHNIFVKVVGGSKLSGYENIGTIYPATGKVQIGGASGIRFNSTDQISIICSPESNDIAPKFNQLVQIDLDQSLDLVSSELDTISVFGTAGASNYTTFSRH